MGDRFVVVPVGGGGTVPVQGAHLDAVATDPGLDTGCGSSSSADTGQEKEPLEDSVFEPLDPGAAVPILEYNREPNKYGKCATDRGRLRVPLLISPIHLLED